MTKSTITRERLQEIAEDGFLKQGESKELARIALAAMDSEPHTDDELSNLLWYSQEATCHSDPNYYCEFQRLATPGLIAGIIRELQERRKAAMDSKPLAYISKSDFDAGYPHILARRDFNKACTMAVYAAQPAPVVPEEKPIPNTLSMYAVDAVAAIAEVKGWNACRAAMLQASPICTCPSGDGSLRWPCPVHPGNSPAIPDSARDALEKALAAMEFMGDTLNNLDAVCTEDVELVAPAFDAVRNVLAAAQQEGK